MMEDKLLRRAAIVAMLVLGSWGWSSATATITITTDSSSELTGSFSALSGDADFETASISTFGIDHQLLPGIDLNRLVLGRLDVNGTRSLIFQTEGRGVPDDPRFFFSISLPDTASRTFADVSGMYNNNVSSTAVYFLFSSLADSGGDFGSFSGNFSFSTSPLSPIPEPEIYAMMLAGLGALGFMAKRTKMRRVSAVPLIH
jgi:hypothetical protein